MSTKYRGLAADLGRRLLSGEFPPGAMLPGETRLAAEYGVSRSTVRAALAMLERRGALEARQGSGWVVQRSRQGQQFTQLRSFADWAEHQGFVPGGRVVQSVRRLANAQDALVLRLSARDEVIDVTRLRTLDGRPAMVQRAVYATWTVPLVAAIPDEAPSVFRAFADAGIDILFSSHRVDAIAASRADAEALGVRRTSPLLRARFWTFTREGRPIAHNDERYLPGVIQFEVDGGQGRLGELRALP